MIHFYDVDNDLHTFISSKVGGPIINDKSKTEAKRKFELALKLSLAVKRVLDGSIMR